MQTGIQRCDFSGNMSLYLSLVLFQLIFPLALHCYYGPPTKLETQAFVSLTIASISPGTTKHNHIYHHTVEKILFIFMCSAILLRFLLHANRQPIGRTRSLSTLDATKSADDLRPSVRCYRYASVLLYHTDHIRKSSVH